MPETATVEQTNKSHSLRIFSFLTESPLRLRFVFFFVIFAITPLLLLGSIALYLIDLSHRHDVSSLELQLIDQKTREIDKFLADTLGILEIKITTGIDDQTAPVGAGIDNIKIFLFELMQEQLSFEQIVWLDVADTQYLVQSEDRINPYSEFRTSSGGKVLAWATRTNDDIQTYSVTPIINTSGEEQRIARMVDRDDIETIIALPPDYTHIFSYVQAAKGQSVVGDVYYTLSGPTVTISTPIYDEWGRIIHIIIAEVNLSQITRLVEGSGLGTKGYLVLLDKDGALIAQGSDSKNILPGIDLSSFERVTAVLQGKTLDALGPRDRYESFFGGEAVVGAAKRVSRTGWALMAEWPIADADALMREIRNQVFFLTFASIIAVIILAPIFASRLVRPIRQLEKAARAVEQGNFKESVDIHTDDELEQLGNAFNRMTQGLKRLQELKDEFVFIAAHELRAPTTVIKGYVSMLLEGDGGKLSDITTEYLGQTKKANDRLLKLVEDLLEVARSEAGRIAIELTPLDMREPTKAVMEELKPLANEKQIALVYNPPMQLAQVSGNSDRIKEVLVNLVNNAIKYTQNGGQVQVLLEEKGGEVVARVQDNGFGMSAEAQKKLFEKFYRVKTDKTQNIQGTGLGLFIVKQLVEKMNGRIWVESEEGKGSTFSFSLPIVK